MGNGYGRVMFTPAVQALQAQHGSRRSYARMDSGGDRPAELSEEEVAFLGRADHFFLATVSETGWPYVQHRGGPAGILRVIGPQTLAFADFRGNQQFISAGNVATNERASILVMDYAHQQRLKIAGRLRFVAAAGAEPSLIEKVRLPNYSARLDRVAIFEVQAFDWNCPQHIVPRYTVEEIEAATEPLRQRIAELEARLRQHDRTTMTT